VLARPTPRVASGCWSDAATGFVAAMSARRPACLAGSTSRPARRPPCRMPLTMDETPDRGPPMVVRRLLGHTAQRSARQRLLTISRCGQRGPGLTTEPFRRPLVVVVHSSFCS